MTREEAILKLQQDDVYRGAYAEQFISGLEALGLITFENKPPMVVRFNTKDYPSGLVIMVDGKVILP